MWLVCVLLHKLLPNMFDVQFHNVMNPHVVDGDVRRRRRRWLLVRVHGDDHTLIRKDSLKIYFMAVVGVKWSAFYFDNPSSDTAEV